MRMTTVPGGNVDRLERAREALDRPAAAAARRATSSAAARSRRSAPWRRGRRRSAAGPAASRARAAAAPCRSARPSSRPARRAAESAAPRARGRPSSRPSSTPKTRPSTSAGVVRCSSVRQADVQERRGRRRSARAGAPPRPSTARARSRRTAPPHSSDADRDRRGQVAAPDERHRGDAADEPPAPKAALRYAGPALPEVEDVDARGRRRGCPARPTSRNSPTSKPDEQPQVRVLAAARRSPRAPPTARRAASSVTTASGRARLHDEQRRGERDDGHQAEHELGAGDAPAARPRVQAGEQRRRRSRPSSRRRWWPSAPRPSGRARARSPPARAA